MKVSPLNIQIEQELTQIQLMVAETERMLQKVERTGDQDYLGTVALNLQSFYTAVERIFIAIAKEIDTVVPNEENWHQALLGQMAVEIPGTRQPVLAVGTQLLLDEFRRFWHVVRSNYAHQLEPELVQALAKKLALVSHYLSQDCQHFCAQFNSRSPDQDIPR